MWGKILIGIVIVVCLFYGLGIFLQGSSSSFVQSRVDRAYEEMDEIGTALRRAYEKFSRNDVGSDPRHTEFAFGRADRLWPEIFEGFINVADPFDPERGFYLSATLEDQFVVISPGPNRMIDVSPALLEEAMSEGEDLEQVLQEWTYDPENGTKSKGDLFLIQEFGF